MQYDDHSPLSNGFIALEDGAGSLRLCTPPELAALLSAQPPLPLAIVTGHNAPQIGQAFVTAGVPHVVICALPPPASSPLCAYFLQSLYPLLLSSEHTVQTAFDAAIAAVVEEAALVDTSAVALLPSGVSHAMVPFPGLPKGIPDPSAMATNSLLKSTGISNHSLASLTSPPSALLMCNSLFAYAFYFV